jgi:hypothetical protein
MEAHVVLGVSLLVAFSLGAVLVATSRAVTNESRGRASADLEAGRAAFERLLNARAAASAALTRLVTELPVFRAHLSDPRLANDQHTMDEMTDRYRQLLRAEFCIVTGLDGRWISNPGWPVSDAPTTAVASTIANTLRGTPQRRVLAIRDRLFLVVAEPVLFADEVLGAMAVAYALDDGVAEEIARAASFDVNLVAGTRVSGSSLGGDERKALEGIIVQSGGPSKASGVAEPLRQLGSKRYVEGTFPMPAGLMADDLARLILLKDWEATEDFLAALRWQSAAAAGIVFVLAGARDRPGRPRHCRRQLEPPGERQRQ